MDRHEAHGAQIAELDGRVGLAGLGLQLGVGEVDEGPDVAAVLALVLGREALELVDVGQAPLAVGKREDVQVVSGRRDDPVEQLVEGHARREAPLGLEAHRERAQALAVARRQPLGEPGVLPREERLGDDPPCVSLARLADERQRVGRRADERRRQHPVQRDLVARVGEDGKPSAQVADDLPSPVAAAADGQRGETDVLQRPLEDRQRADRAEQHDDVLRCGRAGLDELRDALCEQPRLGVAPPLRRRQSTEVDVVPPVGVGQQDLDDRRRRPAQRRGRGAAP